ncbi:sensor histidine kinase [Halovivax cerinus]|uniref:histidine kinase n=1 Tax=Halovivax cerinus TaxID=1487865 RepID=A0ABD5NLW3_9EURY|nr:PAS domain-containing sensor histidine kinase [Halovivax cerinus]
MTPDVGSEDAHGPVRADGGHSRRRGFDDHPDPLIRVDGGDIVAANDRARTVFGDGDALVGGRADEYLEAATDGESVDGTSEGSSERFEPYVVPESDAESEHLIHFRPTHDGYRSNAHRARTDEATDPVPPTSTFEQYETIMQVVPDPVYATDETGTLTFVNRAFEERFGIDRVTVAESDVHFSEITTDDGAVSIAESLRGLLDDDAADRETIESVAVTADGRHLTVENSLALRPSHDGFAGAVGVLRDVTERQRREEIFAVMDRALRHNLRTNVNIIAGYAETLEPAVDDEHGEALRTIRRAATWLSKLGETVRTLERSIETAPDGGHRVDVDRLVTDCAEWARERYPSASIDVTITAEGELDAGDPLEIALQNVVENAIVHNDGAEPTVEITATDARQDGWVDLTVADDGPGVPEEERSFVLGTAMPTQLTHGSGLGLWLTSWIVQVFDGEMDIRENDPTGAVVTLTLRRMETDAE